jgi:glutathione S-transferase
MSNKQSSPGRDDPLVLWGTGTSRVMRAHWILRELDLPYQNHPIRTRTPDMDRPEFAAISPQKKIPILQHGNLVLSESSAIVTYLAERFGSAADRRDPLIPSDPAQRAHYFQWVSFACMELDATSLYVLRRHADLTHIYGDAPNANQTAREYFDRMVGSAVQRMPANGFLLGDTFSGADIIMTTCLLWGRRYGRPLPDRFDDYLSLTTSRPAYQAALDANKPPDQS